MDGAAHITGGGITDNLPRVLLAGTAARVNRTSWRVPAIFRWIGEAGRVPEYDLRRALNMGIGMILVVAAKDADPVRKALDRGLGSLSLLHHADDPGQNRFRADRGGPDFQVAGLIDRRPIDHVIGSLVDR